MRGVSVMSVGAGLGDCVDPALLGEELDNVPE